MSFFGLELAPGKKFTQTVEIPFRVSMVALGHGQVKKERSTLTIKTDSEEGEFALCSLTPGSLEQQPVDLVFEAGEEVTLQVHGGNKLFLTGNYADEEDMMDMDPYSEDDEEIPSSEEEELDEDAVDKQAMQAIKAGKGKKVSYADEEMEEDSEEMDSEEMDSEEDEYELTPEEEADMEEMFQKLFAERLANGESVEDLQAELEALAEQDSDEEDSEEEDEEEPRITEVVSEATLLDANGDAKKTVEAKVGVKPVAKKDAKKVEVAAPAKKEAKKVEAAPVKENNKKRAAEAAPEQAKKAKVETKTLPSGVQITDTKVGDGPRAKNGKRISMHYVGKLTSNNKQFDATKGKPFDFALGRGEVIKGFDIGVEGMQVNGERRIVIPAKLAYGNRKLPGIPANSSLTFDIKLVNVK